MRLACRVLSIACGIGACTTGEPPAEAPMRAQAGAKAGSPAEDTAPGAPPAEAEARAEVEPDPPAAPPEEPTTVPSDARIVMQRTACHGTCPTYLVQLAADGTVKWDGRKHVRKKGEATGSMSTDDFAALWRELAAAPLAELPQAETDLDARRCPEQFSSHPTVRVTLESGGEQTNVLDYQGCMGNPALEAFRELETRIDEVAGTAAWIRR